MDNTILSTIISELEELIEKILLELVELELIEETELNAFLAKMKTLTSAEKVMILVRTIAPFFKKMGQYFTNLGIKMEDAKAVDGYACFLLLNKKEKETFAFLNNILIKNPNAPVHMSLGDMYYYGIGVSKDFNMATKLYREAVNNCEVDSSVIERVSLYYFNAAEEAKDISQKMHYYLCSFRYGNNTAGNNLGSIEYSRGSALFNVIDIYKDVAFHGEQDMEYRPKYDKLAIATAFNNMGWLISEQYDDEDPQAFKYFKKAAALGLPLGFYHIGYMYEYGLGVSKNLEEAYKWYTFAANDNCEDAKIALKDMKNNGYGEK